MRTFRNCRSGGNELIALGRASGEPYLLVGLFVGVLADRVRRKRCW